MDKLDQAYLTDLVIRSQKGSSNAFAELYTATQERVCRYLGSLPGAEDLAAALRTVMTRALQSLGSLTEPDLFLPWLCHIGFRLDGPPRDALADTPAGTVTAGYLLQLPLAESQVLLMRCFQDFSEAEIGDILNLSPGLVRRCERLGKRHLLRGAESEAPAGHTSRPLRLLRREKPETLNVLTVSSVLEAVFEDCGRDHNTVPTEALSSYAVYRKERFSLQRGILAAALVLFFLLPALFVLPRYDVSSIDLGERGLPVYTIRVYSAMPVGRVTAAIRSRSLPVYEAERRVFSVEPTRNGDMTVTVELINRQSVRTVCEVTAVDAEGPSLDSSRIDGATVLLQVSDAGIGVDYKAVYAVDASGSRHVPLSVDEAAGEILFAYPEENWDVYIPDHIGNTLHLAMTLK